MSSETLGRVKAVLDEALRRAPAERRAFLEQACGGDDGLRGEVQSLLEQEAVEASLLESPIFSLHTEDDGDGPEHLTAGRRIGLYKIVRELGTGGMGTVALAVREDDFEKQVALKLIQPGLVSEELVRRFHNERQILAHLDHSNIARILDGGTTEDGLPYFVMEYVEGEPIDRFCARRELTLRERLELFRQVCSALQVAHQSLIVHRDLKPGNILVTADGQPKLLDFGIAKRLAPEPGSELTGLERKPMTLRYASPEQIENRPITTASDIYSLGVLLYRLLTGRFPHRADGGGSLALARAICEQEPIKPSVAVRQGAEGEDGEGASRSGKQEILGVPGSDARQLRRRLAGDLDSILLKALRKDPRQRYDSVEQLSEDVRRYLTGLPVTARTGTLPYVASKFIQRYSLQLAAAILLFLALAFAAATALMWRQAERERELKNDFVSFLDQLFLYSISDVTGGDEVAALAALDRVEQKLGELEVTPPLQAEILESMSRISVERGLYEEARPPLERALELRRQLDREGDPKLARAINNLAGLEYRLGNYDRAEELWLEVLARKHELSPEEADIAKTLSNLAAIRVSRGDFVRAGELYRKSLEIRRQVYGPEDPDVATSLRNLGHLLYLRGDVKAAEPLLREALEIRRSAFGNDDKRVATVLSSLGRAYHALGRHREAEENYAECLAIRRARLGEDHSHVAAAERDLAALLVDTGDLATAERLLHRALATFRRSEDEDSWQLAETESVRGALLTARGEFEEAERLLIASHRVLQQERGEEAIYTRKALARLRALYDAWGKPEMAAKYQNE